MTRLIKSRVSSFREFENDDVAALRSFLEQNNILEQLDIQKRNLVGDMDSIGKLGDQDVVADEQSSLHGAGRNLECLQEEGSDEQGEQESNENGLGVFTKDTLRALLGL